MSADASDGGARAALLRAARDELVEHGHAGIGLRAVARRAGVSHAAPTYFFRDRAGMLTAVAVEGFRELGGALAAAMSDPSDQDPLTALGRAYVDFGLANPALFDLMFRASELRYDDPAMQAAQDATFGALAAAVAEGGGNRDQALAAWAMAHGIVVLARDGALQGVLGGSAEDAQRVARSLIGPLRP